jgi:hypothetical protein
LKKKERKKRGEGGNKKIFTDQSFEPRGTLPRRSSSVNVDVLPVTPNSNIFQRGVDASVLEI